MRHPRLGYVFAILNAVISGVAVYVSSLAVGTFHDAVLYTSLKNAVVGVLLLIPLAVLARERRRYRELRSRDWAWLLGVAVVGGSVPYALFFTGLKMTSAVTGSLGDHLEFALVAIMAVVLLKERLTPAIWAGLAVLLAGVLLGSNLNLIRWNEGTALILASTVLFALEWVVVKHLLRGRLHPLTVMTAKMALGSVILFGYLAVRGGLTPMAHLTLTQWGYTLLTGGILLGFTATIFIAIRHARVSTVMAIGAGAPLVTEGLQLAFGGHIDLVNRTGLGLLLTFLAVVAILAVGLRQEHAGLARRRGEAAA